MRRMWVGKALCLSEAVPSAEFVPFFLNLSRFPLTPRLKRDGRKHGGKAAPL